MNKINKATKTYIDNKVPFLTYKALITQSSTAAPTVKVLQNELSAAIVWSRTSAGLYVGTLAGAFTADKTYPVAGALGLLNKATFVRTSADAVTLATHVLSDSAGTLVSTATDALITDLPIEIQVYP